MVSDLDIWRTANLLIREHGADAELEAARLQDLMLDRGDDEGRRVGDRSAAGAGIVKAKLKLPRASVVREAWDRLLRFRHRDLVRSARSLGAAVGDGRRPGNP
jgi:hypothetical protein